jgi:hypothetical protein
MPNPASGRLFAAFRSVELRPHREIAGAVLETEFDTGRHEIGGLEGLSPEATI